MSGILVVDDEESIRYTLEKFLLAEGHEVLTARNYEEAVEFIDRKRFDIIFVDIMLEDSSGLTVLREIRNRDKDCPVIMITGYPHLDSASEALRLQAFDYIPKPVTYEKLLAVTKRALQHRKEAEQADGYRSNIVNAFMSVQNAIIAVDNNMRLIAINDIAGSLCGFSNSDLNNKFAPPNERCRGGCVDILMNTIKHSGITEKTFIECLRGPGPGNQLATLSAFPLYDHHRTAYGAVMSVGTESPEMIAGAPDIPKSKLHNIVGMSAEMRKIYSMIEIMSDLRTTVLVTGESGTGKELVAEALHYIGRHANKPFVRVNCAALSEELLGSELFGHVRGAFTGAIKDRTGRFQMADGGSIFLDEIGDISPGMQSRLLRVLQEMEFERVGDSTTIKVDVRVIAAANCDLAEKVEKGLFRKDLYYRLKVVELLLPPLKERKDDIPLLVNHFIHVFNRRFNKNILSVSDDVLEMFMHYAWDGNIRELQHTLEYAFIQCGQSVINRAHLPRDFAVVSGCHADNIETIPDCERIIEALKKAKWNKTRAAQSMGISRSTFYRKIYECNIM